MNTGTLQPPPPNQIIDDIKEQFLPDVFQWITVALALSLTIFFIKGLTT